MKDIVFLVFARIDENILHFEFPAEREHTRHKKRKVLPMRLIFYA